MATNKTLTTGERMRARRKEISRSAEQIAELVGLSPATIYRYENGDIEKVPGGLLEPLSEALLTTPAYLMGWASSPTGNMFGVTTRSSNDHRFEEIVSIWDSLNDSEKDCFMETIHQGPLTPPDGDRGASSSKSPLVANEYKLLSLYRQLDTIDQERILERIETMLESEKYSVQDVSKNA